MELATITGTIYRNKSEDETPVVWPRATVLFTPVHLYEQNHTVDSITQVKAKTDTEGAFSVNVWPGRWNARLPDKHEYEFVVLEGQTASVELLKGYIPGPEQVVYTVEVSPTLAQDIHDSIEASANAVQSASNANNSATAASSSATAAATSANEADISAQSASTSASGAQTYRDESQTFRNSAQSAQSTASSAATVATTARDSASQHADNATQSSANAENSATSANTARTEAAQSAINANDSASAASQFAVDANESAQVAATESSLAQTANTTAQAASTTATNARAGAENARDTAGSHAAAAAVSETNAAASATTASEQATNATQSATSAENSATSATQARDTINDLNLSADATTLSTDEPATANVSGELPNLQLDLGLPKGETGDPGVIESSTPPVNEDQLWLDPLDNIFGLTTDVTTLAPGTEATAVMDGTHLSLGIPQGTPGTVQDISALLPKAGGTLTGALTLSGAPVNPLHAATKAYVDTGTAFELRGTGMPNGVVAAPVGTYYTDAVGTNGAWRWLKKTGTGNTGWNVVHGDTGWRSLQSLLSPEYLAAFPGMTWHRVRRVNDTVEWALNGITPSSGSVAMDAWAPLGFRPYHNRGISNFRGAVFRAEVTITPLGQFTFTAYSSGYSTPWCAYTTNDPWPTTLPGTPS